MYSASGTKAYAKVGLESSVMSATPGQLITLLFDGALSALVRARLFLQEGNLAGKGESLSRAINIIENGLKVGLDESSGDELADNLLALYSYMVRRLLQANLHNDSEAIQETETLLRNIADAWKDASSAPTLVQEAI